MSSDDHGHSLPEAHPDTDDYTSIQQMIVGVVIFVVVSMLGLSWWIAGEVETTHEIHQAGGQQ